MVEKRVEGSFKGYIRAIVIVALVVILYELTSSDGAIWMRMVSLLGIK